jgi:hypothetical protein
MSAGKTLRQLVPDAASVETMHVAELGGYILEVLVGLGNEDAGQRHRGNFCGTAADMYSEDLRRDGVHPGVFQACAEAWLWLEANQLICPQPKNGGWYFVTRKGAEVRDFSGVRNLIESEQLPASFVHPSFLRDVRSLYMQGRYDTAVFEAFRLLEVAIRDRAGLGHDLISTKLAGRASHPKRASSRTCPPKPANA